MAARYHTFRVSSIRGNDSRFSDLATNDTRLEFFLAQLLVRIFFFFLDSMLIFFLDAC